MKSLIGAYGLSREFYSVLAGHQHNAFSVGGAPAVHPLVRRLWPTAPVHPDEPEHPEYPAEVIRFFYGDSGKYTAFFTESLKK